jgi:hypothetical protein
VRRTLVVGSVQEDAMTDDFDPTRRSGEASTQHETPEESRPDELRVTAEELSTPHDQPAEGGREQAEDGEGEDAEGEEPGPPTSR